MKKKMLFIAAGCLIAAGVKDMILGYINRKDLEETDQKLNQTDYDFDGSYDEEKFHKIEEAKKEEEIKPVTSQWTDHENRIFESKEAMCKYWNVAPSVFDQRVRRHWNLAECLKGGIE